MSTVVVNHEHPIGGDSRDPAPGELELVRQFVNTLDSDNGFEQVETLREPADLERWLRRYALLDRGARIGSADLRRAIEVRQALRALLLANNGAPLRGDAIGVLNRAAERAPSKVSFGPDGSAEVEPAASGVDAAIARLLAVVEHSMVDGTWQRLKACANPDCEWAFYDHARNRSSRWCTMSECGNRAKARAFRERRRSTT